ncbi:restriction endonuclease [Flavobacterium beibuense]|uniref:Restriction endonuclease n=1 Tax=Flavobacterium beibuense TaxID=657326 RepID=A0A444WEN3_9FLAO|nr:restriction endonuclease [Flavobacterium beibuense]RYJ44287.1 restriction endonuclease [Flavobacterium beibuense]
MIDFSELPDDGIKFEQLIREILIREGYDTHWTGIGPDGGRDLIITEVLNGPLSKTTKKWVVSCKHYANSGRSVGREELGSPVEDCLSIKADGYILVTSTQPSAPTVTRLEEIGNNNNITTLFWDSIEIEKKLLNPNTFSLIHTFFPVSCKQYQWQIYNANSPSFWAANYKQYFLYMSSRDANAYPNLKGIETIVSLIERVEIYKGDEYHSHDLRVRAVYYDDKHCVHTVFMDYLYDRRSEEHIVSPDKIYHQLTSKFTTEDHKYVNQPDWDLNYVEASFTSDHFHPDHKDYYLPFLRNFETGSFRGKSLSDMAYYIRKYKR